ncbi:condensation domain-containing protein [Streptomyces sp. NPDC006355]|uniref:condensation domain-containing protein n=1 Tax=Streptomyces sp. NPDC006355 TaxID=3156758 RepID=UPI0033BCD2FF
MPFPLDAGQRDFFGQEAGNTVRVLTLGSRHPDGERHTGPAAACPPQPRDQPASTSAPAAAADTEGQRQSQPAHGRDLSNGKDAHHLGSSTHSMNTSRSTSGKGERMSTDGHHPSGAPTTEPVPVTVTVTLTGGARTQLPVLDVHGPLPTDVLDTVVASAAGTADSTPAARARLRRHGPAHHTLRLTGRVTDGPALAGLLADRLTRSPALLPGPQSAPTGELFETFAATPLQRDILADALIPSDHHVEQLYWRWHGPLDTGRFTAAWQSVFDRETVLRAAFVWDPHPRVVLHRHSAPDVVRHPHGSYPGRAALMEHERGRGFDLRRPGMLRAALLDGEPRASGRTPPTDILLTYHRSLLDLWSVHGLLREFYRAYRADGLLPGGERRPDLRDYVRWQDVQDPSAAKDFWRREADRPATGLLRAQPGATTGRTGTGRAQARLTADEAACLAAWAAHRGVTESIALHAVWAVLLYRASGAMGTPARVRFHASLTGRGVFLDDIERTPGPFANPLPVSVEVDPRSPVSRLLHTLRDRALDMSAYEWVSAGQIRDWLAHSTTATGVTPPGAEPVESLLVFQRPAHGRETFGTELAPHGFHVEHPELVPARTAVPIGVVASHNAEGGLMLTSVHDRARIHDAQAAELLFHSARLLRTLPFTVDESTTVADILQDVPDEGLPRLYDDAELPGGSSGPLVTLRAATTPHAGTVCLVVPPGTPPSWPAEVARGTAGLHAIVSVRPVPFGVQRCVADLRLHLGAADGPLVLAGLSGIGVLACDIALRLAQDCGVPPPVVLGSSGDAAGTCALTRAIEGALKRSQAGIDRHSRST